MPELGLGTMSILKYGEAEGRRILEAAYDAGIRHFDTADVYDHFAVERLVGSTFAGRRDELFLTSKGGNVWTEDGMRWNPSASYLKQALSDSLERLQTDYLDVYYVHGGTIEDDLDETIAFMRRQKQAGVIRQIGLSSIRPNVIRYWLEHGELDVLMTPYSLLDRRVESLDLDIPIVGRGPLAKGLLTAAWSERLSDKGFEAWSASELRDVLPTIPTPIQAYALAAAKRTCAVVLPGASSVKQLNDLITANQADIDSDKLDELLARLPIHPYTKHAT
ncbi:MULTISPECIES: aldo/keto reductase [Exiguobacterium]|uniref:aldo/keto reductase n=1 Tax=Exiguobacterium TaxID=33986 RepID=UPI001BE8D40F|nr:MULTISPECIES: aldo/keto reductase [Exiguobacterium]MCT4776448.1 aldo/keto reductase [Exiguobacterium aquaticum]MCT4788688.1 aldo/keto reductase [Exiguobacterium mexicanum]